MEQHTGLDAASWGGNLSIGAQMRSVAGVIVDGPVRDIDDSRKLDFPVFARDHTARTARGRIVEVATKSRSTSAALRYRPATTRSRMGAPWCSSRRAEIERVLEAAEAIVAREEAIAQAMREGQPIGQVMGANYEHMLKKSIDMNNDDNILRASKLDTTALSDAMDRLGIGGQCLGIKPLNPSFRLTGRAFTILYGPAGMPAGTVGDYIDDVAPGGVVVLDNGGRENATVWGDILTMVAHTRGVAGTVIDGACRDVALALELGYPIFSRSYSMRTGKDRVQVEAMGGAGEHRRCARGSRRYSARRCRRTGGASARARERDSGRGRGDRRSGGADPPRCAKRT